MKSTKGFLIMLIGMISMTAFATTSEPTRKSETTFVQHEIAGVVANVVAEMQINYTIVGTIVDRSAKVLISSPVQMNSFPVSASDDVGWYQRHGIAATNQYKSQGTNQDVSHIKPDVHRIRNNC